MIMIFNDPLSDTFLMENMPTRQHDSLLDFLVTNCTSQIMKSLQLLSFYFFEKTHSARKSFDSTERLYGFFDLADVVDTADDKEERLAEFIADP